MKVKSFHASYDVQEDSVAIFITPTQGKNNNNNLISIPTS